MTFWHCETPEYDLQTASNLQPFCDYRNGNTTKPPSKFPQKTVYSGVRFTFVAGSNRQFGTAVLLRTEGWSRNCRHWDLPMGIVSEMTTRTWDMLCLCVASTDGSQAISELYENISVTFIKETDEFIRDYRHIRSLQPTRCNVSQCIYLCKTLYTLYC
jgi:hypothetical protein